LNARAEERARVELEQTAIDKLIEISEVEYPPILVDREIGRMLNEESRHFAEGVAGLENYLKTINKTMEDHREELRPIATKRVVRSLVLGEMAEAEKIAVEESEIDAEVEKMAKESEKPDDVKTLFSLPQARESVKQFLVGRKAVEYIANVAKTKK